MHSHCDAAREFAFEQIVDAVKRPEIIEIEIFVLDGDLEFLFQKLHELQRRQRVDEPEREYVFVISKIVVARKSREKLFDFYFSVHSSFTLLNVVVIEALAALATE
jgi:hypothetical protein